MASTYECLVVARSVQFEAVVNETSCKSGEMEILSLSIHSIQASRIPFDEMVSRPAGEELNVFDNDA